MAATTYTCPWCRMASDGQQQSCPSCGAPVDIAARVDAAGWTEMPAIKDMARIQFGQSTCQIEGTLVPTADMKLAQGESVYFSHHVLLWKDDAVVMEASGLGGGLKRMMAGMPVIMMNASGPGHIAFSADAAGELIAVPLQPGRAVDVREHHFLVASATAQYTYFDPQMWFTTQKGDERETHRPMGWYMDRFGATNAPGLLLLHVQGNAFIRDLQQGESIIVHPNAVLYKDYTVAAQLHFEFPSGFGGRAAAGMQRGIGSLGGLGGGLLGGLGGGLGGMIQQMGGGGGFRYVMVRLFGPGRVAIQSAYPPMEVDNTWITSYSPATQHAW